jgi:hypothetical protein
VNINLLPYFVIWAVLAVVVLVLIVMRKSVASAEDDSLHVLHAGAVSQQINVNHKLEVIDKWGKILTAVAVVFGLALAGLYMYQSWIQMSKTGFGG